MDWLRRLLAALLGGRRSTAVDDDRNEWRVTAAPTDDPSDDAPMNISGSPDDRDEATSGSDGDSDGGDGGGDDGGGDD